MKCRLTRPLDGHPSEAFPADWQCSICPEKGRGPRITRCPKCGSPVRQKDSIRPAGTLLDHPQAYVLVRMGVAEPADEECERRADRSPAQLAEAAHAAERTAKGIHPDDFAKFDAGEITGYAPNGDYTPGPNFPGKDEEEEEDDGDE